MHGDVRVKTSDFQLASIIYKNSWQDDDTLHARFVFWAHNQLGLAWQRRLYTTGEPDFFHIRRAVLYLHDCGFKRIELHSFEHVELLRRINMNDLLLARLALQIADIVIIDLRSRDVQKRVKENTITNTMLNEAQYQSLYHHLVCDKKDNRRANARYKRLWRKLISDPVLFFKDSKTIIGIYIFKLICLKTKRYVL